MALVTCRECKKQVSSMASSCVHCGAVSGSERQKQAEIKLEEAREKNQKLKEENNKASFKSLAGFDPDKIPRCPICRGTRLSKVTLYDRIVTSGFIGTAGKTIKCDTCGATF